MEPARVQGFQGERDLSYSFRKLGDDPYSAAPGKFGSGSGERSRPKCHSLLVLKPSNLPFKLLVERVEGQGLAVRL